MTTFCTCNHDAADHARRAGRCHDLDSYGLPCACPSLEPDPNTVEAGEADVDAAREQALLDGHDMPPREPGSPRTILSAFPRHDDGGPPPYRG